MSGEKMGGPIKYDASHLAINDVTNGEIIVTISSDGHVWVNPKYMVEEAAKAFWDQVLILSKKEVK